MLAFSDGRYVGAILDRNGLRPARYYLTADGHVYLSSEVGVNDLPIESIVKKVILAFIYKLLTIEKLNFYSRLVFTYLIFVVLLNDVFRILWVLARTFLLRNHLRLGHSGIFLMQHLIVDLVLLFRNNYSDSLTTCFDNSKNSYENLVKY